MNRLLKAVALVCVLATSSLLAQVQLGKGVQIGFGSGGTGNPGGGASAAQFNCAVFCGSKATFDAAGNFRSLSNDGVFNAYLAQTTPTSNNGIQNSLQAPGNSVYVGPDYPCVEGNYDSSGYRFGIGVPAPFANRTQLFDNRFLCNTYGTYVYNPVQNANWNVTRVVSNQQPQGTGDGYGLIAFRTDMELTGSGKNGFDMGLPDSQGWGFDSLELMRRGIFSQKTDEGELYGVGDMHVNQVIESVQRGTTDASGEGFQVNRYQIGQDLTPMATTANATTVAGATLIAGTLANQVPFPGDGTYYVDSTKGSPSFKITGLAVVPGGDTAGEWTVDATLTPDNIGRTANTVNTPKQYYGATTNETITVTGLTSPIVTTQTVCYADHVYQESARVVSVGSFSGGTQTITVALRYTHIPNAYIAQGSHACNFVEAKANRILSSPYPGRQLFRIIGALDAHTYLYSRTVAGVWDNAPGGFYTPTVVAPSGATITRNGANVASVAVADPSRILAGDSIIVSGCADSSYNTVANLISDTGTAVTWSSLGGAGTTTCTSAIEILSRQSGTGVREAQEFPGGEIVDTVDPVTFANNFNITIEPNTNLQVTAGDVMENDPYNQVGIEINHELVNWQSSDSDNVQQTMHSIQVAGFIPPSTYSNIAFTESPIHYLGLGGTKPILNTLFELGGTVTPFLHLFDGLPSPAADAFTFNTSLYGFNDSRSQFTYRRIAAGDGSHGYSETIHQDTGLMHTQITSPGGANYFRDESPAGLNIVTDSGGPRDILNVTPGFYENTVGDPSIPSESHLIQLPASFSIDKPLTITGTPDGCGTFTSGVLGSTGVACGSGGGGITLTTTGTSGAATLVGTTLNIPVYTPSSPGVASFNSRTGAVVPVSGDYSFSLLTGSLGNTQGPSGLTGLLKDAAGTLSAAIAGTDYVAPTGSSAGLSVATSSVFGVVKPDNSTITISGGILSAVGGGGNTISTALTPSTLPKANGPNSIIDSKLSDDGTSLTYNGAGPGCISLSASQICITAPPYNASGAGATTTTTSGTFGVGTTGNVNSCSTLLANNGILITGAGAAGVNYIGKVVSCSGTALTVTPATSTSVAGGTVVQHDETAAFLAAINAFSASSGEILVPDGLYLVNGPLLDPSGANAILPMPTLPSTLQPYVLISIKGLTKPTWGTFNGAVIQTSATTGNLIGGYDNSGGAYPPFTNVGLVLDNLYFTAPTNPGIHVVDATRLLKLSATHLNIGSVAGTLPSNAAGAGILMPSLANNVENFIDDVNVFGFYKGYVIGEHTHIGSGYAGNDVNGFVFDVGFTSAVGSHHNSNSISADYLWCQGCTNVIASGSEITTVNLQEVDMEVTTGNGILDAGNLLRGQINYNVTVPFGSTGYCNANVSGAAFVTINAMQCQGGATLTSTLGGGFGSALNFFNVAGSATPNVSISNPSSGVLGLSGLGGVNTTLDFGPNFGNADILLYHSGSNQYGMGVQGGEMQFFVPGHYSFRNGAGGINAGTEGARITVSDLTLGNVGGFKFSSTATSDGTPDTGISRDAAGVFDLGNGTAFDKSGSLNLTNLNASGIAGFGGLAAAGHQIKIAASGTNNPLLMVGGSAEAEIWKDATPTKAVSYGMAVPGSAAGNDFIVSTYDGGSWSSRMTIRNSDGNVKVPTLTADSLTGTGTASIAPGASGQVGTGATAVCATGYVCDSFSGTVTLTTGTGVLTSGTIATVTFPGARTNNPSCAVSIEGGTTFLAGGHSASTTVLTFTDGVAAAISSTYTLSYVCGGS